MNDRVLLVGASVRGGATAAFREGLTIDALDLFDDVDLGELCARTGRLESLEPDAISAALIKLTRNSAAKETSAEFPSGITTGMVSELPNAWQGCGGMEHASAVYALLDQWVCPRVRDSFANLKSPPVAQPLPSLIDRGVVLGPDAAAVSSLRRPDFLAHWARANQLAFPALRWAPPLAAQHCRWLIKQRASGGGLGIERAEDSAVPSLQAPGLFSADSENPRSSTSGFQPPPAWPHASPANPAAFDRYWQREIQGDDGSAILLASRGEVYWVGSTRQWSGCTELGARPFWYSASAGPWPLSPSRRQRLLNFARTAVQESGYEGILGIDFRWRGARTWVLEINPRYPASAEILERSAGKSLIAEHLRVARGAQFDWPVDQGERWGKGVYYVRAGEERVATERGIRRALESGAPGLRPIADLPHPGQKLVGPTPAFTIFTHDPELPMTVATLSGVAIIWETLIFETN